MSNITKINPITERIEQTDPNDQSALHKDDFDEEWKMLHGEEELISTHQRPGS